MTSKEMRANSLFMRNTFQSVGKWDIPLVKKQAFSCDNLDLMACSDARAHDNAANKQKGIHFFVDDYRFTGIYKNPEKSLEKYSQYRFLLTPDFSLYADMDLWRQLESVAMNRWVGAYWQNHGLTVIPTVSWSTPRSYGFCFDGIEKGATVAVGMIGCKSNKRGFMQGYNTMLEKIQPEAIICFGKPFAEMKGNIFTVDYRASRKVVR